MIGQSVEVWWTCWAFQRTTDLLVSFTLTGWRWTQVLRPSQTSQTSEEVKLRWTFSRMCVCGSLLQLLMGI